ncbi:MAG: hypothetical protein KA712_07670 [Myxococcales bacterium]|nr:hypothetical protein [Myxococcales bacterium]
MLTPDRRFAIRVSFASLPPHQVEVQPVDVDAIARRIAGRYAQLGAAEADEHKGHVFGNVHQPPSGRPSSSALRSGPWMGLEVRPRHPAIRRETR